MKYRQRYKECGRKEGGFLATKGRRVEITIQRREVHTQLTWCADNINDKGCMREMDGEREATRNKIKKKTENIVEENICMSDHGYTSRAAVG